MNTGGKKKLDAEFDAVFIAMSKAYAGLTMSHLNYDSENCLYVEIEPVMIRNFYNLWPDEEGEPTIYVCILPEKLLKSNQRRLYRSLMDTLAYLKNKNFAIINTEEAGVND